MAINVRRVYLYLTSFIGLILILIGAVQLVNLGLKTWVFPKADREFFTPCLKELRAPDLGEPVPEFDKEKCELEQKEQRAARRQADAARSIAFIIVGAPVWFYHWNKVKDERHE